MPKKVKHGAKPAAGKQVKITEKTGLYQLSPKWSFAKCDMQHEKWGISRNAEYLGDMLARFKEWERGTWGEILTATAGRRHNTQSHPMPVEILDKEAARRFNGTESGQLRRTVLPYCYGASAYLGNHDRGNRHVSTAVV